MQNLSDSGSREFMLIGNVSIAFNDAENLKESPCEVYENILEGIDTAAKYNFKKIGVVASGMAGELAPALKALRTASRAKIILLVRMYEEPLAVRLVNSANNGAALADDYLICPVQTKSFLGPVLPDRDKQMSRSAPAVENQSDSKRHVLEELATTDELTGLKNRRYIWEFARQIIEHSKKTGGRVTLLMFDIDNFKHYNDVYGHPAGDEILKQAAVLMKRSCRWHDVVGRIGGDEFTVVFWDDPQKQKTGSEEERRSTQADHPKEVLFIAQRFRRELNSAELPLLGPEGKGVLAISGGLASYPRDGSTIEELFKQADTALLDAKRSGKNRIYIVGKPDSDIADIR